MAALDTVADVSTGYPFRTRVEPEEGGDLVLVQIRDRDDAEGFTTTRSVMLRSQGGREERYLLEPGDLLFTVALHAASIRHRRPGIRGIAAAGLHVIRPQLDRALPGYLAWWLNHPVSQARIRDDLAADLMSHLCRKADLAAAA